MKKGCNSQKTIPGVPGGKEEKMTRVAVMPPPELIPLPGLKQRIGWAVPQEKIPFLSQIHQAFQVFVELKSYPVGCHQRLSQEAEESSLGS